MAAQLQGPAGLLTATGTVRLGSAGEGTVGRWVFHVSGTWTGTLLAQGYVKESSRTSADLTSLAIVNMTSGATVAGGTGTTANGIFWCDATGLDVTLSWTRSSGSIQIDAYVARG